jgi:hypothetical protein
MKHVMMIVMALAMLTASVKGQQDIGILIFNHQITTGMTFANVQAAWGNPYRVDRTISSGFVIEWWWYQKGLVVFINGRVDSIS